MGVLYARVAGAWVPVVASGGGSNEVYVGTDDPIVTYPDAEIWYDSDAPTADIDPTRQWNSAWGSVARVLATSDITGITTTETTVASLTYAGFLAGRRYRLFIRLAYSMSVATDSFFVRSYIGGTQVLHLNPEATTTTRVYQPMSTTMDVVASGSQLVKTTVMRASGSGVANVSNANYLNGILEVIDDGPVSGAVPAPNPTPAWTPLTFVDANWRSLNASSTWQTGYRKVGDRVELRGLVQRLNTAAVGNVGFAQLPAGFYAPGREAYFAVVRIDVNTTGAVFVNGTGLLSVNAAAPFSSLAANAWLSLDGVSFSVTP